MNPLVLHIEYLLRRHDCVIIPSLGAFIASRRPAYFDREAHTVRPPHTEIVFNARIVNNDGLLANSVSRRLAITYAEAVEMVKRCSHEMHNTLASQGLVQFGRLGTLELSAEGKIVYTPAHKRYSIYPGQLHLKSGEAPEAQTETPAVEKRVWRTDKYYYIPVHKMFARVAACLILAVAVAVGIMLDVPTSTSGHQDNASVVPVRVEAKAPEVQTPSPQQDTVAREIYHLVVGTFTDADEVKRFMARHEALGFDLKAVQGKRYIRVTAGTSHDREKMVALMRTEKIDTCFRNAWIWKE